MGNQQVSPKGVGKMNILAKNAKIGDGCLIKQNVNASASFNGKSVQWLGFKRDLAIKHGYNVSPLKPSYSGYKDDWSLVQFSTKVDSRLTEAYDSSVSEVVENLTKLDLIIWYIDDGSWHKTRKTMHLYCNAFSESEVHMLCEKINTLYGSYPTVRTDRKKDGRAYPYLYFPRPLTNKFWRDVRRFIRLLELDELTYKVGETSTTIRNGVAYKRGRSGEMPLTAYDIV